MRRSPEPAQAKPADRLAFLLYFGATLAPRLATLASMLVLTRVLPVAEYGLFVLVVVTGEILESTTTTWIRLLLLRTEAGRGTARPRALRRARILTAGAVLMSAAAVLPIGLALERERAAAFATATIAYVAAASLLRFRLTLLQIEGRHAVYNRTELLRALGILAGAAGPLSNPHSFLPTSLAISASTALVAGWGLVRAPAHFGTRRLRLRGALAFGAPIVLSFMVVFALRSASQYALEAVLGLAAVGMFSAAASLAQQPMELVTGALNAYTYPLLLRRYATAGTAGVAEAQSGILLTLTALGAGIVGLILVACEPAAALVLPPAYRAAAVEVMPWVSVGSFCFALKQFVFDNCFHVAKRNWLQLGSSAASAVIGVVVTIGCVAAFGLRGAAPGFAAASALALLSSAVASRWALPFPIPRFRIAAVLAAAAAAGGGAWAVGPILSGAGPFTLLTGTTALFGAVYVVALTCAGFSLKRLLSTPWAPLRPYIEEPTSDAPGFASHGTRSL